MKGGKRWGERENERGSVGRGRGSEGGRKGLSEKQDGEGWRDRKCDKGWK